MAGPRRGKREEDSAKGARILIVEARYYDDLADLLLAGATNVLEEAGAEVERISVPGSLEIAPAIIIAVDAAQRKRRPYDGVVALGCVIRGDTTHYETVCHNANHWLMHLAVAHAIPLGNGILTVETEAQAMERAQGGRKGKGADAVRACLAVIALERVFADEEA